MRVVVASESALEREQLRQAAQGVGLDCAATDCVTPDALAARLADVGYGLAILGVGLNTPAGLAAIHGVESRKKTPVCDVWDPDAAVDLPFALPTAVAGIAMAAIYAPNGVIGSLADKVGLKIAYTPLGITLALVFIGLPFVVRTVQPVLEEVEQDIEEAAALLGASRLRTVLQVVLPHIYPALLTGFALAFARGVGEYGSVIFIAGNIPQVSEIAPLLIVIKLEEFDYGGATVIATLMLAISFAMLFVINALQARSSRKYGNV